MKGQVCKLSFSGLCPAQILKETGNLILRNSWGIQVNLENELQVYRPDLVLMIRDETGIQVMIRTDYGPDDWSWQSYH